METTLNPVEVGESVAKRYQVAYCFKDRGAGIVCGSRLQFVWQFAVKCNRFHIIACLTTFVGNLSCNIDSVEVAIGPIKNMFFEWIDLFGLLTCDKSTGA